VVFYLSSVGFPVRFQFCGATLGFVWDLVGPHVGFNQYHTCVSLVLQSGSTWVSHMFRSVCTCVLVLVWHGFVCLVCEGYLRKYNSRHGSVAVCEVAVAVSAYFCLRVCPSVYLSVCLSVCHFCLSVTSVWHFCCIQLILAV
jgi:hypothetical protein